MEFSEKIKKLREEAGLTKQKVAQLLTIPQKYLDWMEEGTFEKMPPEIYVKGFLKKYAKILSINAEEIAAEYEGELKNISHEKKSEHTALPILRSRRFVVTPKTLIIVFGVALFLLIFGYLAYQLDSLISPPVLVIFEPATNFSTSQTEVLVKGKTDPGVKLTINGQEIYIDKDGIFEKNINLNQGLNSIHIEAINRFEKRASETRRVLVK